MSAEWCSDFSYEYFEKILVVAKRNFNCSLLGDAPEILQRPSPGPRLFLRHDVDFDLSAAIRMAELENRYNISATYMVMVNSPFYRVDTKYARHILLHLVSLGQEVGLHYYCDRSVDLGEDADVVALLPRIQNACQRLEDSIQGPVRSFSLHRPLKKLLGGNLFVGGRVNAYARVLLDWYLSDSKGSWRDGEPLPKLLNPDRPLLQLLVHPIWWGESLISPRRRLERFLKETARCMSEQQLEKLNATLDEYITIRPRIHRRG